MSAVIRVENLAKAYQLGEIGTGTISRDLERFWARMRGKEDPFLKIGEVNDRAVKGTSDVVWSLKDLNFEIEAGQAVGIIGSNGAGKSTLLKILSRVTAPTRGSAKIRGRIASLLEVGTGFHPELSGKENIYLNGAILGMRKAEIKRKFDEIVDFSGVERYVDTPVKRYSSGMYVRLAFAVAAHLESEIMIVDEVLAVGDAEFQKKCLGKMGDVSTQEGRTILFVSHNMDAINKLTSSCIYLENGSLKHFGTTNSVINLYRGEFANQMGTHYQNPNRQNGFTGIYIKTSTGTKTHYFTEPLEITFNINLTEKPINAGLAFQVIDSQGRSIINPIIYDDVTPWSKKGDQTITAIIEKPRLVVGKYTISAHLGDKQGRHFQTVEDVCAFEIMFDITNNQHIWVPGNSAYIEDVNWSVQ
ncbi:MAG: polysaccharide ABC transporter ATP-binding protein [Bacteroidota bacterium]|nr:polysaccharide ABC transporter ATP-binding protein [Bacteroidota bacterium]